MATKEHLLLSSLIKSVHQDLRSRSRVIGYKSAWAEHCMKKDTLDAYASAMYKLATQYWENNNEGNISSRIEWVVKQCHYYFFDGGMKSWDMKEEQKLLRIQSSELIESFEISGEFKYPMNFKKPLFMLDVGSCYNPFKIHDIFETLPIDLTPATMDVYSCDFLQVLVQRNAVDVISKDDLLSNIKCYSVQEEPLKIHYLPRESFDVVNFSLFLEYLPSAELRYDCCRKAYDLLKPSGLLFIITPDSKHQSANAPIMRNWRIALETIGFLRVEYEKLTHLHCMAFRKCPRSALPKVLAERETTRSSKYSTLPPTEMMVIPQDFYTEDDKLKETKCNCSENKDSSDVNYFSELPLSL